MRLLVVAGRSRGVDLCGFLGRGGCAHEITRTAVQRFHVLQGERHIAEFDKITLLEKFRQQRAMSG